MFIKPGKKTKEWDAAKRKLKPAFAAVGIIYCEVGPILPQFGYEAKAFMNRHSFFLTWAHGDKRINLVGDELITLVALSCLDCHNFIERLPREEMRAIIEAIIAARRRQPSTYHD